MSKYSDFRYTPYTNSTNSQFSPALYSNTGAVAGCVGTKCMSGGGDIPNSSYYGLKTVDANTASTLRGSYPPMTVQSHGQCAGKRSRKTKFKKHYMWNTKGKRYTAKTHKQHLRGVKLGHTHRKCKTQMRRKTRRCQMCPCCKCKCKKCCAKPTKKRTRRVKRVRMNGGSSLSNASYTTLTKLSPTESMLANPVPFGTVKGCVDNYNHYQASKA